MTYLRENVWQFGADWADPILWYARGVAAMKQRPLATLTSWRFLAAIHGFDPVLWQKYGYLSASDPLPPDSVQQQFWAQCQHSSWYFLPWHRGYLLAFEENVRAAIVSLGGPDDWALPYWNYSEPNQNALPPAFASADWPDGTGDNPLFVQQRWGPNDDGNVYVPPGDINLKALSDTEYTGDALAPEFGGVQTGFWHDGGSGYPFGNLEAQPHNMVHIRVGGGDPSDPEQLPGLMTDPDTAGLDPIFWLHHSNIDRLWEVWRRNPPSNVDPTDPKWLQGPRSVGDRGFFAPRADGSTWGYTPADVDNLATLGYTYDDLSPAAPARPPRRALLQRLGVTAVSNTRKGEPELLGASAGPVRVTGTDVDASVQLDRTVRSKLSRSFLASSTAPPDRVFLKLENVRGIAGATALDVYVGLPPDADPSAHPDHLAGKLALFGLRSASNADGDHAGNGLTFSLEITDVVDKLHLENQLTDQLPVRIVPSRPVSDKAQITIGRVSVFRRSG